ncbi:hypothetical protein HYE10_03715 [Mycoplasmopsis bovis]|nr:hypothetical protein HYE10_03715 [Mycoplasmopsis bovis]
MKKNKYDTLITIGAILGIIGGILFSVVGAGIVSVVLSAMCLGSKKNDRNFIIITAIINWLFAGLIGGILLLISYSSMPEDNNRIQ